jgi:hypothetical protein
MQGSSADKISEKDSLESMLFTIENKLIESTESLTFQLKNIRSEIQQSTIKDSNTLENLSTKIESQQPDLTHQFIYPLVLSILAGFIFWLFFTYLPEQTRKKKIRTKIDFEIYQVYTLIFSIFDLIFRHHKYSPSNFQSKIRSGDITPELIEMGLQNKCMNEHYFYDTKVSDNLMPIGKKLWEITRKTDQLIDRIFNFSFYLTSREILLLDEIRKKLHTYDVENYDKNPATIVGGNILLPVNPSLSYMKKNLSEIYQLYIDIQTLVFKQNRETRDLFIHKVQLLFNREKYKEVIKHIQLNKNKYLQNEQFLNLYLSLSFYRSGKKDKAFDLLEKEFASKINLVSYRNTLKEFGDDKLLILLLQKYYTQSEIIKYKSVIEKERIQHGQFVSLLAELKKYYKNKS